MTISYSFINIHEYFNLTKTLTMKGFQMLEITDKAKEQILKLFQKHEGRSLRIFSEGFG